MSGSVDLSQTRFAIDSPCSLDAPTRQHSSKARHFCVRASPHDNLAGTNPSRTIDSIPLTFAFSFCDIVQVREQNTHLIVIFCSAAASFPHRERANQNLTVREVPSL